MKTAESYIYIYNIYIYNIDIRYKSSLRLDKRTAAYNNQILNLFTCADILCRTEPNQNPLPSTYMDPIMVAVPITLGAESLSTTIPTHTLLVGSHYKPEYGIYRDPTKKVGFWWVKVGTQRSFGLAQKAF